MGADDIEVVRVDDLASVRATALPPVILCSRVIVASRSTTINVRPAHSRGPWEVTLHMHGAAEDKSETAEESVMDEAAPYEAIMV